MIGYIDMKTRPKLVKTRPSTYWEGLEFTLSSSECIYCKESKNKM